MQKSILQGNPREHLCHHRFQELELGRKAGHGPAPAVVRDRPQLSVAVGEPAVRTPPATASANVSETEFGLPQVGATAQFLLGMREVAPRPPAALPVHVEGAEFAPFEQDCRIASPAMLGHVFRGRDEMGERCLITSCAGKLRASNCGIYVCMTKQINDWLPCKLFFFRDSRTAEKNYSVRRA